MKNFKKWLFYIAYTLVAMGLFLYFLFPSETFKGAVSTYLLKACRAIRFRSMSYIRFCLWGLGLSPSTSYKTTTLLAQIDRLNVMTAIVNAIVIPENNKFSW